MFGMCISKRSGATRFSRLGMPSQADLLATGTSDQLAAHTNLIERYQVSKAGPAVT